MCGGGVYFGHVFLKRPALYDFLRRTTTPHSSLLTSHSELKNIIREFVI